MILVDSSVWIDYFRGVNTRQSDTLDSLLGMSLWRSATSFSPKCSKASSKTTRSIVR
jgi:hypothetical protein